MPAEGPEGSDAVGLRVRIARSYGTADLAERVVGAVSVDDPGAVEIARSRDRVVLEVRGTDPASVRRTLDDLLACLAAAERTAGFVKKPGR
ncbi:MAG TPA: KEOPS complex subunit Pcc1 [Thermoplasmata archaeon]|nr:KEOPS complex subunit Pcc1 [Thermoplasmata archaeon]